MGLHETTKLRDIIGCMSTEHKFRINISTEQFTPSSQTKKYYLISLVLIVLMVGVILFLLPYLPKQVPLFFTEPWGEARLSPKIYLLLLPGLATAFMIINLALARSVKDEAVLSKTVAAGNLLIAILLAVSLIGIIQSII